MATERKQHQERPTQKDLQKTTKIPPGKSYRQGKLQKNAEKIYGKTYMKIPTDEDQQERPTESGTYRSRNQEREKP